jgi:hypothetical protein
MNPKFPIFLEKKEFAILAVNKFLKLFLKKGYFNMDSFDNSNLNKLVFIFYLEL